MHVCVHDIEFHLNLTVMFFFSHFCVEQQFNQIEKQLISCNAKLESEKKQHERLQKEHEETGEFKLKREEAD